MTEELYDALAPLVARIGLELVDVERHATTLVVTVDREGGIDLDGLAQASSALSAALDELDPFPGRYTLEVSSPGLERRLRTPAHYARAVGETVTVRTQPGAGPARRLTGTLVAADREGFSIEGADVPDGRATLRFDEVERARTVFEWGASPAPSPSRAKGRAKPGAKDAGPRSTRRVSTP
jgi:ribosome maturation factor RimP